MKIGFYIDARIGDSVVVLPALRALRQSYPQSKLYVFTNAIGHNLYSPLPWIDSVMIFESIEQVSSLELDYLISSNCDQKTIQKLKNSTARKILTYLKPYNLLDFRIKSTFTSYRCKPQSAKQNALDLVNLIIPKLRLEEIQGYQLQSLPKHKEKIDHFLAQTPSKPRIMLNPFGFAAKHNLTLKDYEQIAQKIVQDSAIILPTFEGREKLIQQSFSQELLNHPHFFIFKNDSDLLNLVALIAQIDLLISPSTGNIHIADNLGIPSIALFSQKDSIAWGGQMHYVLLDKLSPSEAIEQSLRLVDELLRTAARTLRGTATFDR